MVRHIIPIRDFAVFTNMFGEGEKITTVAAVVGGQLFTAVFDRNSHCNFITRHYGEVIKFVEVFLHGEGQLGDYFTYLSE